MHLSRLDQAENWTLYFLQGTGCRVQRLFGPRGITPLRGVQSKCCWSLLKLTFALNANSVHFCTYIFYNHMLLHALQERVQPPGSFSVVFHEFAINLFTAGEVGSYCCVFKKISSAINTEGVDPVLTIRSVHCPSLVQLHNILDTLNALHCQSVGRISCMMTPGNTAAPGVGLFESFFHWSLIPAKKTNGALGGIINDRREGRHSDCLQQVVNNSNFNQIVITAVLLRFCHIEFLIT